MSRLMLIDGTVGGEVFRCHRCGGGEVLANGYYYCPKCSEYDTKHPRCIYCLKFVKAGTTSCRSCEDERYYDPGIGGAQ